MQRGCCPIGASQRFGNPVVSVSNIKYISSLPVPLLQEVQTVSISTVYLTSFQHFKISKNQKNRTSNLGFLG
jgi:hypothetical protein